MKEFWDDRYSKEDYAYGTSPNLFFKEAIDKYNLKGKILLAAEGEGRNAVYAAQKGLQVFAFDISEEAKKKALRLAKEKAVEIHYEVGDFFELKLLEERFDAAALIYAHLPPNILPAYHQKIGELLKSGGFIILEGFSENNLELRRVNPKIGGPDKIEMLYSIDKIKKDFPTFDIILLEEKEVELKEGAFHDGVARVIRFIGRKKS